MENFKTTSSESKQPYNPIKEEQLYLNSTTASTNNAKLVLRLTNGAPIYAGWYRIGGEEGCLEFSLATKPKFIHRKFCELLLGWKWIDNENYEN
jgi:hypothetical protein